jgi:hypothetical protein
MMVTHESRNAKWRTACLFASYPFYEGVAPKASECEALSREAPLALPVEGLLKPNSSATLAPVVACGGDK